MWVAELWRFPVKSMGGERLDRAILQADGIAEPVNTFETAHDRNYACGGSVAGGVFGGLIQTISGGEAGEGAPWTKRSGWAA